MTLSSLGFIGVLLAETYAFNLPHDLTTPTHWEGGGGIMQIYECDLLAVCHHPDHRHCDIRDVFLICLLISPDNMFKGVCGFMGGSPSM